MLQAPPKAFHPRIILPSASSVKADLNAKTRYSRLPLSGCVLTALIRVKDSWKQTTLQSLIKSLETQIGCHIRSDAPPEYFSAGPIHDCTNIIVFVLDFYNSNVAEDPSRREKGRQEGVEYHVEKVEFK